MKLKNKIMCILILTGIPLLILKENTFDILYYGINTNNILVNLLQLLPYIIIAVIISERTLPRENFTESVVLFRSNSLVKWFYKKNFINIIISIIIMLLIFLFYFVICGKSLSEGNILLINHLVAIIIYVTILMVLELLLKPEIALFVSLMYMIVLTSIFHIILNYYGFDVSFIFTQLLWYSKMKCSNYLIFILIQEALIFVILKKIIRNIEIY